MWKYLLLTLAMLTLNGTALAADVEFDYDTSRDYSQLHYYDWQTQNDAIDEAFKLFSADQIQELLGYQLDLRAEKSTAKNPADFLVRYSIKRMKKFVDDRPRIGLGMGGFNDSMGGGVSFSIPLGGNELDQTAQIVVDMLDAKTQQLIWRGSLVTNLSSSSVTANQKQLQKAFELILKRFPPKT